MRLFAPGSRKRDLQAACLMIKGVGMKSTPFGSVDVRIAAIPENHGDVEVTRD